MSNNFLKTYKKCVVKTIVTPGLFWMTEYEENNKVTLNDLKIFESFLLHEVIKTKKRLVPGEIFIGQIVAVIGDNQCCRGLITDIFDKNSKHTYEILLIDHGNSVTTTASNICLIENDELREKESVAFRVSLHGVVPVTLDINIDISSNTVFQKRISKTWSAAALKFVKSYLKDNCIVYVKFIEIDNSAIKGDIYVVVEQDEKPVALSKLLCDKDFAVVSQENSKLYSRSIDEEEICDINDIEKKIPHTALSRRLKNLELYRSYISSTESSSQKSLDIQNYKSLEMSYSNLSLLSGSDDCDFQYSLISQPNGFHSTSPEKDCVDTAKNFSSSWILKKIKVPSINSQDSKSCIKSDELENISELKPKNHKFNFFELVKRNEERKRRKDRDNCY